MKKSLMSLAVISALLSTHAFAADAQKVGFYGGAEIGYSKIQNQSQEVANSLVSSVGGAVSVTQSTGVGIGRLFAGYNFNESLAFELGYLWSGDANLKAAGVTGNSVGYTANYNASVNGIDYSLLVRPSVESGWNGLFGRIGGHYLDASRDITSSGGVTFQNPNTSSSGGGFLVGIGYDAAIADKVDFRGSYTYYDSLAGGDGHANVFSIGVLRKF